MRENRWVVRESRWTPGRWFVCTLFSDDSVNEIYRKSPRSTIGTDDYPTRELAQACADQLNGEGK